MPGGLPHFTQRIGLELFEIPTMIHTIPHSPKVTIVRMRCSTWLIRGFWKSDCAPHTPQNRDDCFTDTAPL